MSLIDDSSSFDVTTSFDGRRAVLALHGKVEGGAAFRLSAALEAAIDFRTELVVLDLSDLDFMGAAGLVALANAERRFAQAGVELTIRTPSRLEERLLDAMELTRMACPDKILTRSGQLGREQVPESKHGANPAASGDSAEDLGRMIIFPTDPGVVDAALRFVVELAQISVSGAHGVSVSLLRHGELQTVAATDQTVMEMDNVQYVTGQGPCIDASLRGHCLHVESLEAETRWPSFTPRARCLGVMAILSLPLTASRKSFGALNIYSGTASAFGVAAQRTAAAFAREASVILRDARADVSEAQLAARFKDALQSQDHLATASVIVTERESLNQDDAFSILLRQSLASEIPVPNRADDFAHSTGQQVPGSERESDD